MSRIALSMIVKDAAATLRACFESVAGVVDEIVIADTGSSDATAEIARECDARVIEIPWENDFAGARNRALAEVRATWVLVLDADEILDPGAKAVIPRLVASSGVAGYQVTIRNYVNSLESRLWDRPAIPNDSALPAARAFPAYVEHENVRLFRRDPRIFFVGRVHESVGSRIEDCGLRLGRAPFLIHHFGLAEDIETRTRKNRLYHELGQRKVEDTPRNAQAHLELGLVELDDMGNVEKALECFRRACEYNPRLGVAWFFAGVTLARLGKYREALECLEKAEKNGRATGATAEISGDAHYELSEFRQAVRCYEEALNRSPQLVPVESKLGLARVRAGMADEGLKRIQHAIEQQPANAELHDRLVLGLTWLERTREAALAAENKLRAVKNPSSRDFMRAASLWSRVGDWSRAIAVVHVGLQVYRDDAALKRALEELALHAGPGSGALMDALSAGIRMISEH
ncbi:MAG TPA: glycosyltransferase [Candidatus Acidoferrum sp.]|nr:glycosyltransferase [Candidatus Acidoferrum sp.]